MDRLNRVGAWTDEIGVTLTGLGGLYENREVGGFRSNLQHLT